MAIGEPQGNFGCGPDCVCKNTTTGDIRQWSQVKTMELPVEMNIVDYIDNITVNLGSIVEILEYILNSQQIEVPQEKYPVDTDVIPLLKKSEGASQLSYRAYDLVNQIQKEVGRLR